MSDKSALRKIKPHKGESDRGPTLNRVVKGSSLGRGDI